MALVKMKDEDLRGCDVVLKEPGVFDSGFGGLVAQHLIVKGFCVVGRALSEDLINRAVAQTEELEADDKFQEFDPIMLDGFLGAEGSARVAELTFPSGEGKTQNEVEDKEPPKERGAFGEIDDAMTEIGLRLDPYTTGMNFSMDYRTASLVHQAGLPETEAPALNIEIVHRFFEQFVNHKIMVIYFLGPTPGSLELTPYTAADAETHSVKTGPGMLVILRPDLLRHEHFAPGASIALSSFFLRTRPSKWQQHDEPIIPVVSALDGWISQYLLEVLNHDDESVYEELAPEWKRMMGHLFRRGQNLAVVGAACRFPYSESPDTWFESSAAGPDLVTNVPLSRWDHQTVYDPDPEGWKHDKSFCQHGGFMEGIELFDAKFFGLSANEAATMDPNQRLVLEVGYSSLYTAGMRKRSLSNFPCSVYIGNGLCEWQFTPKEEDTGPFAATGAHLAITAGRFSFTLGLKGASMVLDTEGSSGATAIYLASESIQVKGRTKPHGLGCAMGVHACLSPVWWPSQCALGWLSKTGRCLTFDASADGYVRADGCGAMVVKNLSARPEEEEERDTETSVLGAIAGAMSNNNGLGASLTAPSGPAEQQAIVEAFRNAGVEPLAVDSVEAHGSGGFLADAIEVGSLLRSHRGEEYKAPLAITALKSSAGNQIEAGGVAAFMRLLKAAQWGFMAPNIHLQQANPHLDNFEQPCAMVTEMLENMAEHTYNGLMSRGFGGTNVYILGWGRLDPDKSPNMQDPLASAREQISFWPGGGGVLQQEWRPTEAYSIIGSWSKFEVPEKMVLEEDDVYVYTVTLGENRWESFQILLDGDRDRVLHPGSVNGSCESILEGPVTAQEASGLKWLLDGRPPCIGVRKKETGDGESEKADTSGEVSHDDLELVFGPSPHVGEEGDRYRVRLQVLGKWRNVSWEKLPRDEGEEQAVVKARSSAGYFLKGSWNDWTPTEMEKDESHPHIFRGKATLTRNGGTFCILRDNDEDQILYPFPGLPSPSGDSTTLVMGPDWFGAGMCWTLKGKIGDAFVIEFETTPEGKKVSWRRA